MATLKPVSFDPFKASPMDLALDAEGVTGPLADVARSIYMQESSGGKNTKTSNAGAVGGMQIIPSTFNSVAEKDWDINDPIQNARAGLRYIKQLNDMAGGDPRLVAAGYYGGPGGLKKARAGQAVSDPRNPHAPNTLQYADQVASRLPKQGAMDRFAEAVLPAAQAAQPQAEPARREPKLVPVDFDPFADASAPADTDPFEGRSQPGVLSRAGSGLAQGAKNLAGGLVRGAGSIGATLLAPGDAIQDAIAGRPLMTSNRERRQGMDAGLQNLIGADTDSFNYGAGKLVGEIAGTAGVGPALGAGAQAAGAGPQVVNALRSGGMTLGGAPAQTTAQGARNLLLRTGAGAATGGASAGLVNPEDAGIGALIGGGLPVATKVAGTVGNALGRSMTGGPVAPEVRQLAQRAQDLGIDVPVDRIANSKPLNALAASLDYVPFSGRTATMDNMQSQFNQAISRTFGQDSDNVTLALRKARDDLGSKFDKALTSTTVKIDQPFLDALSEASERASAELGQEGASVINRQIDEIMRKGVTGEIDGQAAYNIKNTLDRIGKQNTPQAFYAGDLRKDLMAALNRSMPADEAAKFAETRRQYGNMLSLQKLAQNGVDGDISVARVANLKNINNPELQEIADIAAQFLRSREGQHGAAQRAIFGIGGSAGAAGAAGAAGGLAAAMDMGLTLGTGVALGRGANAALSSQAVRNRLLSGGASRAGGSSPVQELLYRAAPVLGAQ